MVMAATTVIIVFISLAFLSQQGSILPNISPYKPYHYPAHIAYLHNSRLPEDRIYLEQLMLSATKKCQQLLV